MTSIQLADIANAAKQEVQVEACDKGWLERGCEGYEPIGLSQIFEITVSLGKIARQSPKGSSTNTGAQTRLNRRNYAKQQQLAKRSAIVSATRIFSGVDGAPRIISVIPLSDDVSSKSAVEALANALDISQTECTEDGVWKTECVEPLI